MHTTQLAAAQSTEDRFNEAWSKHKSWSVRDESARSPIMTACERAEDHAEDADTLRRIAASANRIDALIAAFAFGVILGWWIA